MVTKNQIKLVKSLQQKKYRSQHGLFVVEGRKTVFELIHAGFKAFLLVTDDVSKVGNFKGFAQISSAELNQMSSLNTSNGVLGVFHIPSRSAVENSGWTVVLDSVRDPGNLGTIIRLCDWFGISNLVCSEDTVDCYNPKVLQATMGSIARVNVAYLDLTPYLKETSLPIYGAFMDGDAVYEKKLSEQGILILGNEANGISAEVSTLISERIAIPQFGEKTTESLNVATATAILLSEIRRRG